MKETLNANIGSEAFTIDEDAYDALQNYFDDIRSRLPESDAETMNDIEARMAEIFRERITSPMQVVTLEIVRAATARMGAPADFGERRTGAGDPQQEAAPRRLYRSRTDRSIAGICGGIAEFFGTDSTPIRLMTLLLILFGGLSLWIYILFWIVIPDQPAGKPDIHAKKR